MNDQQELNLEILELCFLIFNYILILEFTLGSLGLFLCFISFKKSKKRRYNAANREYHQQKQQIEQHAHRENDERNSPSEHNTNRKYNRNKRPREERAHREHDERMSLSEHKLEWEYNRDKRPREESHHREYRQTKPRLLRITTSEESFRRAKQMSRLNSYSPKPHMDREISNKSSETKSSGFFQRVQRKLSMKRWKKTHFDRTPYEPNPDIPPLKPIIRDYILDID